MALILRAPPSPSSLKRWDPLSKRLAVPQAPPGPGRTLHEIYTSLGSVAETAANRAAHNWGLGPLAVAARVSKFFEELQERELKIRGLQADVPKKLSKDCLKLIDHALPSGSAGTQMDAFQSIVDLSTRYPGLRAIFLEAKSVLQKLKGSTVQKDARAALALAWARDEDCGPEWDFFRNFAAACMVDTHIAPIVEETPCQNTCIDADCKGLNIVERLSVNLTHDSDADDTDFSSPLAIRYLAGILELPSFWTQSGTVYEGVFCKIISQTSLLLKDIGVDSSEDEETGRVIDFVGIDNLCTSILRGVRGWIELREDHPSGALTNEFWFESLVRMLKLLRQPKSEEKLPNSWFFASIPEMEEWIPTPYELRVFSALASPELPGSLEDPSREPAESQRSNSILRTFFRYLTTKNIPGEEPIMKNAVGVEDALAHSSSVEEPTSIADWEDLPPITSSGCVVEILPSEGAKYILTPFEKRSNQRNWRPWRAFIFNLPLLRRARTTTASSVKKSEPTGSDPVTQADASLYPEASTDDSDSRPASADDVNLGQASGKLANTNSSSLGSLQEPDVSPVPAPPLTANDAHTSLKPDHLLKTDFASSDTLRKPPTSEASSPAPSSSPSPAPPGPVSPPTTIPSPVHNPTSASATTSASPAHPSAPAAGIGHDGYFSPEHGWNIEGFQSTESGVSSGSDIPTEYRAEVDRLFLVYLKFICSNLDATDNMGDSIHQQFTVKNMQELDESTDFRRFKFRIQAFTAAFLEHLAINGYPEEKIPTKEVRKYLWRQPLILRYNEDGKTLKLKGNHIWSVEARKLGGDGWEFRPFVRKIVGSPPPVAHCGIPWMWRPRVWDPHASWLNIPVQYSSPSLPLWLQWKDDILSGTPPANAESCEITTHAKFTLDKQAGLLTRTFLLKIAPPAVISTDPPSPPFSQRPSIIDPRGPVSDSTVSAWATFRTVPLVTDEDDEARKKIVPEQVAEQLTQEMLPPGQPGVQKSLRVV